MYRLLLLIALCIDSVTISDVSIIAVDSAVYRFCNNIRCIDYCCNVAFYLYRRPNGSRMSVVGADTAPRGHIRCTAVVIVVALQSAIVYRKRSRDNGRLERGAAVERRVCENAW